ncbi:hypothetical protein ACFXMT_43190, partial [Streptomyces mirabilis]|uniref:hypothetical protein n=1 Tax=Streptomyces mirabilis TaxID=68239 RepID=UPI0036A30614
RVYDVPDGIVGEDHSGGSPSWWTTAWCTSLDSARELADTRPPGRPDSAPPTREPVWYPKEQHPPHYELKVWSAGAGWKSLHRRPHASERHRRSAVHWHRRPVRVRRDLGSAPPGRLGARLDPGRPVPDRPPPRRAVRGVVRLNAQRRAEEEWLVAALAERSRGVLTAEQVAERLQAGGQRYRDFLTIGSAAIARAFNGARRNEEGAGRLRLREALDALEDRHEVPDWVVKLTRARLDDDLGARATGAERAYVRRALAEYLAPRAETDGVPGLSED